MPLDTGDLNWAWVMSHAGALPWCWPRPACVTGPGSRYPSSTGGSAWCLRGRVAVLFPVLDGLITPPPDWSSAAWLVLLEVLTGGILGLVGGADHCGGRGRRADRRSRVFDGGVFD